MISAKKGDLRSKHEEFLSRKLVLDSFRHEKVKLTTHSSLSFENTDT